MLCLTTPTDPAWAPLALAELPELLVDHAHCELKAAANALALVPRLAAHAGVARVLSELSREELLHYEAVLSLLERRGIAVCPPPAEDRYAALLLKASSALPRDPRISSAVDRLIVAAVIEARSCERFHLLIGALEASRADDEVLALYTELFPSEARHYVTFVELATACVGGARDFIAARVEQLAALEAKIVVQLAEGATRRGIHG